MNPQLGRTAFSLAIFITVAGLLLLPFLERDSAEFVVTVVNNGPSRATNAELFIYFADFDQDTMTTSQGYCDVGTNAICHFGNIAAGGTATVRLNLIPTRPGDLELRAVVTALSPDSDGQQNDVNRIVHVRPVGDAVAFCPPLIAENRHLDQMFGTVAEVLKTVN